MISIIYNTNRYGGFDILKANLDRQTFRNFEVVIADELYNERKKEVSYYLRDYIVKHFKPRPKKDTDAWNFNKAMNDAVKLAERPICVSLQDYIWVPHDGLQRFFEKTRGNKIVSGVGNKALMPNIATNLTGKISIFEKDYRGRPYGIKEFDSRTQGSGFDKCNYPLYEFNYSAFPRQAILEIGGMDEEADKYFSGDNVQFAYRAKLAGYDTYVDKDNRHIGLYHQYWFKRPENWEDKHFKTQEDALSRYENNYKLNYV